MSEQLHGQIDTKQREIETLKGPAEAKKKIREYRSTYVTAVDSGQRELKAAAGKLKSPEAKAFLTKASGEIAGHLTQMATRGRDIIKAHEDSKSVPSMDDLSGKLKKQLGGLKKSIDSFKILEELETKDLKGIEDANKKLNSSPGKEDPSKIFGAKGKLLKDLNRLSPKFTSTPSSRTYAKKVSDTFRALGKQLGDEKTELATGPIARHMLAQDFFKAVSTYEDLVKKAQSSPSIDTLRAVEAAAEKVKPEKAHTDIFAERDTGTTTYIENLYKHLQSEYDKAKKNFEGLKENFDETEKEALTKAAEKMISEVDAAEKDVIGPLWEKYEPLSRRTDLSGKELEEYEKNEKAVMSAYLTLKLTMAPFSKQETQFKLKGEVYNQIKAKIKAVDDRIRQIEVNRETRKSMKSLGEVGANVFTYVTFLGEEKDGKIYKFNAAYDALSDEKKQEVRMAVESIIARDKAAVKAETQKALVELTKSSGNFDKIADILGEKSKKYAEGLKLLASGKHSEAMAAFEAYVAQTFSEEEQGLNAVALADAKEKISLIKYSGDFYEGLKQYGNGDINGAAKNLNAYVKWAEGSAGSPELHKEQVDQARQLLHLIGMTKVKQLDDLLKDVKFWKKKDLQDQYGSGGQKVDFRIEGPEVDIIVRGIGDLKKKVQEGELIDYDEEFAKLKARVHIYLQKNAIDPKNNVIDKFSEMYEGMNSTDPEVRKNTCLKFAKELRDLRGYDMAREYLDKALAEQYREAAKDVSQEKVMQEMLGDKLIMDNVRKAAAAYLSKFKHENPEVPEDQLRQQAEQIVFNMWLKKRYSRELRRSMTAKGLASTDEALRLYNEWSPYEENKDTSWYKPWNYEYMNAEEWDQFKDAAKQNLAITIATLPIGFGAGAVAANVGKFAFRGIATRLLVRTGAAGAEAAIAAIETGGIQAIRFGSQAWRALTPQMQRAVIFARLGAGAISVGVEGTLLLGGSTVAEGLITGHSTPITSASLVESIFKALAFRGIGIGGNKIFGKAIEAGGKRGAAALAAMETMSGLAGTGIEAASLYMKGHGEHVNTGFVLRSLLENAITSTGVHLGHGYMAKRAGSGKNKVQEAYSKQVAGEAPQKLGFDPSKPDTIRTARVTPDGQVIINGKAMKEFDVLALAHLPKKARERILDLAPDSALDTHFRSNFSTDVPKELLPDGNPARANEVHGWIDRDGKIHYNLNYLNTASSPGGPYRGKKILPDGYTAKVNAEGNLVIAGPDGKNIGLRQFLKTPEGKKSAIMTEMKRIKNHESTHQVLEAMHTKMVKGERIEDPSKTKTLKDMFATPGPDGKVPEGKIPLVDHNGKPMDVTWQNVQEYLCHVGDGSIKTTAPHRKAFESAIAEQVPGFTFAKARKLSTKALASNPAKAFKRGSSAAKEGEAPAIEVLSELDINTDSPQAFVQSVTEGLSQKGTRKATSAMVQRFLDLAHGRVDFKTVRAEFPQLKPGQVLEFAKALSQGHQKKYENLSDRLSRAVREGPKALQAFEKSLSSVEREYVKAILAEATHTNKLLTSGKPADLVLLKKQIIHEKKGIGRHHIETLAKTDKGRKLLKELMAENKKLEKGIHDELTAIYSEKIMSRYPLLDPAALDQLVNGRVSPDAMSVIAHDSRKILKLEHVESLIHGKYSAERVALLEKNIDHPEVTQQLAEKILAFEPEVTSVHGKKMEFYDAQHIGEGGLARVFRAAIVGPDGLLTFVGCKKSHDGGPQIDEANTARLMFGLKKQGLDTSHIMEYRYVSDDESLIFFDIHSYTGPDGKQYVGDMKDLSQRPDVPPGLIYTGLLGGAEALAAFEAKGIIQMDTKIDNYVIGTGPDGKPVGIHIDLGYAIPRDQVIGAQLGMPVIDNGWVLGEFPVGIGVTPGYYSTDVMRLIIEKKVPPEKHHNYTFGVALEVMLTGHNKINKFTYVDPASAPVDGDATRVDVSPKSRPKDAKVQAMVPTPHRVTEARPLPTPPYPEDANQRLMNLSKRLKDPYDPITMKDAVAEMKKILASKGQKQK